MLDVGQNLPLAFADPEMLVASCLAELRFPERVAPSIAARRHRQLNNPGAYSGPWGEGPYFVAHLDRPLDCLGVDSPYREVAVMGPAQTGKSEIGNNWQLHAVIYDPTDMLFVMPDRTGIDQYVKTQFDKMVELAVYADGRAGALQDRMLQDTINLKQFRGADLFFLWPGGPTFRSRPIPRGRADDVDDFAPDIAGQGDVASLLRGRMGAFSAYGNTMLYLNSTPKLGKNGGIEALVSGGTDERLWVDCLMCGKPFALYGECLEFERQGNKEDAGASAAVLCPDPACGGVHLQREKRPLLDTYRWVGRGETALPRCEDPRGKDGDLMVNRRASFRLDGLFGFRPWSEIAELGREAEIALEYEQDDAKLKAWDQTVIGRNYVARDQGEAPITEDELVRRAKASPYAMREVPPGVHVLIASVDQQGNRFEVAIWGFGDDFRAWLIDRFALVATIGEDGRQRPLAPSRRLEDWAVLHAQVMSRSYQMAGAQHLRMKLFNTIVDTGGGGQADDIATDNAFAWWHSMVAGDKMSGRAALPATAITLVKGGNKPRAKTLPPPTIDAKRQIKGLPQAELYVPNVNRIKGILNRRLNRKEDGAGYIAFPHDLPGVRPDDRPNYFAELRAETKVGELWVREPHTNNETWDLYVYAYTVLLRFGGGEASMAWVPDWARPPKNAPQKITREDALEAVQNEADPGPAKTVRIGRQQGRSGSAGKARRKVRSVRSS